MGDGPFRIEESVLSPDRGRLGHSNIRPPEDIQINRGRPRGSWDVFGHLLNVVHCCGRDPPLRRRYGGQAGHDPGGNALVPTRAERQVKMGFGRADWLPSKLAIFGLMDRMTGGN